MTICLTSSPGREWQASNSQGVCRPGTVLLPDRVLRIYPQLSVLAWCLQCRSYQRRQRSVAGHFKMEMCTLMKCDPHNSSATCRQEETRNYSEEWRDFLTTSDAIFSSLKLSATFSTTGAGGRRTVYISINNTLHK